MNHEKEHIENVRIDIIRSLISKRRRIERIQNIGIFIGGFFISIFFINWISHLLIDNLIKFLIYSAIMIIAVVGTYIWVVKMNVKIDRIKNQIDDIYVARMREQMSSNRRNVKIVAVCSDECQVCKEYEENIPDELKDKI